MVAVVGIDPPAEGEYPSRHRGPAVSGVGARLDVQFLTEGDRKVGMVFHVGRLSPLADVPTLDNLGLVAFPANVRFAVRSRGWNQSP